MEVKVFDPRPLAKIVAPRMAREILARQEQERAAKAAKKKVKAVSK